MPCAGSWFAIMLFLASILYVPVLEEKYAHVEITVSHVVGLGWLLWLYSFAVRAKMGHVLYMLTPPHTLLDGPPKSFDEEAPTAALVGGKFECIEPRGPHPEPWDPTLSRMGLTRGR